ncbi:hypothetical protein CAI21_17560 [Alkalilimnicola ehrlichii]|uniref:Uncharacterized protein n=1 Tax=Alkalilimnicola ehrlichii TaxID=351052 RepID=A0A3E0WHI5_9GAMM|nr:alpha/beta fold hydrolase [Alkalilimnicola ehrlichii]RFA26141.1 hypothetical protein CAI21_17560 [Alkalilimnicola ehrlichii]RFA32364.1 hypothetical protein CAL65_19980 [Alkalilimnicola ehrlichii]
MKLSSKRMLAAIFIGVPLALTGCGGSSSSSSSPTPATALFDLSGDPDKLPYPTNLLFNGTDDGTLNIPNALGLDIIDELNRLDGWSTVAPVKIPFDYAIDPESLDGNVHVIRTTMVSPGTAAVLAEALQKEDPGDAIDYINHAVGQGLHQPLAGHQVPLASFTCDEPVTDQFKVTVAATQDDLVLLKPIEPLGAADDLACLPLDAAMLINGTSLGWDAFSNGYIPVVTKAVKSIDGGEVRASDTYAALALGNGDELPATLVPLAPLYQAINAALASAGIPVGNSVVSFAFSTQSVTDGLDKVAEQVTLRPLVDATEVEALSNPLFKVFKGRLAEVPYYLNNKPGETHSTDASVLTGHWTTEDGKPVTRFTEGPHAVQHLDIPVLITIPAAAEDNDSVPVVIYQHGLTSNRGAMLQLADKYAVEGWATIAIDHPLHGLLENDDLWLLLGTAYERHFFLDLTGNGEADSSGANFTPVSPETQRDNRRQSVADLLHLLASLDDMDFDGVKLDSERVSFVGISMGGIVGSMLAGVAGDQIQAYAFNVPSGGMGKMSEGSPAFAGVVRSGLSERGLTPGMQLYEDYLNMMQQAQDAGDPINFTARVRDSDAAVFMVEMIGDLSLGNIPDVVVPNDVVNSPAYNIVAGGQQVVETAPLSGSTPLWRAMGLEPLSAGEAEERPIRRIVRYTHGHHASLHYDNAGADGVGDKTAKATAAIQRQTAEFLVSETPKLKILADEESVIE